MLRHRGGRLRGARARLLAIGAVLALLATACGGGGEAGGGAPATEVLSQEQIAQMEELGLDPSRPYEGTTLTFLLCCQTAAQFATLIEKTSEFTELTGIVVEFGDVPYESFQQRLTAASVTGEYDLVAWIDGWGPSIAGALEPLDDRLEEAGRSMDEYPAPYAEVVTAGNQEGRILGLPLRGHPYMSFYRTDVLEENNLEVPETWDDYEGIAQTVADNGTIPSTAKYYGSSGGQNLFEWVSRMWSNGGDFFNEDMEPIFNEPATVEATEDYVDYIREGLTPDAAVNWNEGEALTEFVQGRAANFNGWWWMYGNMINPEIATQEVIGNVEFAPAPAYEGGEQVTYAYLWPMGILNQSDNVDAAWEYLNWATAAPTELEILMQSGDPGGAVHLSTMENEEANERFDGLLSAGGEILQKGRALPLIPEWPEIQSILAVSINEMANGADAQEQLDDAADRVRSLLDERGYYD